MSGLVAFTTLTRSLQLVSPSLVASLRCVELVAAFAVQSLLTSTAPSLVASTGGGLIILGVLVLAFQPQLDHYRRGFLNFDIDIFGTVATSLSKVTLVDSIKLMISTLGGSSSRRW